MTWNGTTRRRKSRAEDEKKGKEKCPLFVDVDYLNSITIKVRQWQWERHWRRLTSRREERRRISHSTCSPPIVFFVAARILSPDADKKSQEGPRREKSNRSVRKQWDFSSSLGFFHIEQRWFTVRERKKQGICHCHPLNSSADQIVLPDRVDLMFHDDDFSRCCMPFSSIFFLRTNCQDHISDDQTSVRCCCSGKHLTMNNG